MTSALQQELARWAADLAALEEECAAEDWTTPERLLTTVQKTLTAYRGRILPRLSAGHDLALPALPPDYAPAAVAAYDAIVADELTRQVNLLEELRRDFITGGTPDLQLRIAETLAALRVLAKVALRFGQEVELPRLAEHLSPGESAGLAQAVHRYEKSLQ